MHETKVRSPRQRKSARRSRALSELAALVVVAAVVVGVAIAASGSGEKAPRAAAASPLAGIPQQGRTLGSPAAPVTVEEFADLQCPACRVFAESGLPVLVDRYVRTARVRLVFRNLTFLGRDSVTGAQAAAAAGEQNLLWGFVDAWYRNQGEENSGYATEAFVRRTAAAVPGLDVDRMLAARSAPAVESQLREAQVAAERARVQGTPSFLVERAGRTPVVTDAATLQSTVDRALAGR
jgi:protein-disulfide isomerase